MNLARGLAWSAVGMLTWGAVAVSAAEPAPATTNAALVYWQALALLPEFTDAEQRLLEESPTGDDHRAEVEQLLGKCQHALRLLDRGARLAECDFGVDAEADGPHTLLPHLTQLRQLARVALADARHALAQQRYGPGVERTLATLRLARHVGQGTDDGFIALLVSRAMEQRVVELLAEFAPRLPPEARQALRAGLDAAPRRQPLLDALRAERRMFVGWMRRELTADPEAWRRTLDGFVADAPAAQAESLREQPPTPAQLAAQIDALDAAYAQLIAALGAPLAEREAAIRQVLAKAQAPGQPLVAVIVPQLSNIQRVDIGGEIRERMLRAGLARLDADAAAFAEQVDPVTGQPFELRARDDGFELHTTTIGIDDRPIALGFGVLLRAEKD